MTPDLSSADVRALRPAHEPPDPWRPLDVMEEPEREAGRVAATATLFLAGGECRFTCVFCDLWRFTTPEPTPIGAIPAQIDAGLARLVAPIDTLKLYNASNFFDERAVPAADDDAILERVGGLERLVVECHPALVAERARRYARELGGRLEVAMGLETADEACHARLGKGTRVDDFRRAAERLHRADADVRIFLLVAPPFQARERRLSSLRDSLRVAEEMGARHVSLVPTRGGNGALERLAAAGSFSPPDLDELETSFTTALAAATSAVVTLDLWDLERHADCRACLPARRARLQRMNLEGSPRSGVACDVCGAGA